MLFQRSSNSFLCSWSVESIHDTLCLNFLQRLRTCSLPNLRLLFETATPGGVEASEADTGEEDEDEVDDNKDTNDEQEGIEGDDEEELDEEDGELDEDDDEEELNIGRYE